MAVEFLPEAIEFAPVAVAFSPEAEEPLPVDVALLPDADELAPVDVAPLPDAFEFAPVAVEFSPEAEEPLPVDVALLPDADELAPVDVAPLPDAFEFGPVAVACSLPPPEPPGPPVPPAFSFLTASFNRATSWFVAKSCAPVTASVLVSLNSPRDRPVATRVTGTYSNRPSGRVTFAMPRKSTRPPSWFFAIVMFLVSASC
ncbi:hypothetical protein WJ90_21525 [Burkholderia ubonensis]|nr:hypothetical protein WJ90_21525 [Burkholderia ubonensis]KVR48996.1 hypothetical protein WK16_05285 [Burkholderia ubonensis]